MPLTRRENLTSQNFQGGLNMRAWILAARPKTLPAAIVPVIMGCALALEKGSFHTLSGIVTLLCAILIQIGTNFVNDYADFKRGADNESRKGPLRVTQAGLIKPEVLVKGAIIVFILAFLFSIYLIQRGGWVIAVIGVSSILSGIFYTAGPRPLGYMGLGDIFVLIFFGPVAVWGTWYIQTLSYSTEAVLAGIGAGMLSVGILTVNNIRDIEEDRKSGKNSLVVRFGKQFGIVEYFTAISFAALIPVVLICLRGGSYVVLASFAPLFFTGSLKAVASSANGEVLNKVLEDTGKMLLLYGILFSFGWLVRI